MAGFLYIYRKTQPGIHNSIYIPFFLRVYYVVLKMNIVEFIFYHGNLSTL